MSSNYGFEPTLDGLNAIDADSTITTDIICDNLIVNVSGTSPTMTSSDNSTHIATTAFVANAISGAGTGYVNLTGTQTISGQKTFSNANTYTTGVLNCSNASGLALNVIDDSNFAGITVDGLSYFNDIATFNLGATFNYTLPTSTIAPVSAYQLCNYAYVNSVVGGTVLLASNNTWTGTNTFNNTLDVIIGGTNQCNITSSSITLNPTTTITNQIGGVSKMTMNSATSSISNSTIQLQYLGTNKIYITNTNITVNPTTTIDLQISGTNMLQITSSDLNVNASAGFTFIPTGTINTSVVSTVPTGFLYCDGTAVSRATYARLYAAIGTTFGVGNGTTTFNVPNFKGAFLRGASTQTVSGVAYTAAAVGTVQQDMALTTPQSGYSTPFESTGFRSCAGGTRDCLARTNQGDTPENPTGLSLAYPTGRFGTEVRPMNYSVYYYIKY